MLNPRNHLYFTSLLDHYQAGIILLISAKRRFIQKGAAMTTEETLTSPRLLTLQRDFEAGHAAALAAFWQEVTRRGTPLIEPIAGEDKYALVTFVCQAPSDTRNVSVVSQLSGQGSISEPMTCLPGTDLWHKTYRVRNDLRAHYRLALDDAEQPDPLNPNTQVCPADEESFYEQETTISLFALPAAPSQVWIRPRAGGLKGQVEQHILRSNILNNERRLWVYTPALSCDCRPIPNQHWRGQLRRSRGCLRRVALL